MTRPKRPSWDDYRRRRRLFWLACIGYLPVAGAVGLALNRVAGSDQAVTLVALAWMGFLFFAAVRMNSFPCPRCGRPFFHTFFVGNPLARRCMRCGWPKWVERRDGAGARHPPPLEPTGPTV